MAQKKKLAGQELEDKITAGKWEPTGTHPAEPEVSDVD